jgi:hypothetical protein
VPELLSQSAMESESYFATQIPPNFHLNSTQNSTMLHSNFTPKLHSSQHAHQKNLQTISLDKTLSTFYYFFHYFLYNFLDVCLLLKSYVFIFVLLASFLSCKIISFYKMLPIFHFLFLFINYHCSNLVSQSLNYDDIAAVVLVSLLRLPPFGVKEVKLTSNSVDELVIHSSSMMCIVIPDRTCSIHHRDSPDCPDSYVSPSAADCRTKLERLPSQCINYRLS